MEINAADVMKLRNRTGMQMMKCKAALTEAGGDMEKAVEILRKQNKDAQAKSADRETTEGRISVFIDPAKKVGAILELRCESAPVAKSDLFVKLSDDLVRQIAHNGTPASVDAFLASPFIDNPAQTVNERIGEVVGLMRENVKPARMGRFEGTVGHYVHHDGSVGVLLSVGGEPSDPAVLRDVCMHVTATNPIAATKEQLPQDRVDKELEIARAQAQEQGKNKPADIINKIAEGKLKAWVNEQVLAEQPFVKDPSKTVTQVLSAAGVTLKDFVRLRVGEVAS